MVMTSDNGSIKCGDLDTNFFDDLHSSNSLRKEENEKIKLNNAMFESTPAFWQVLIFQCSVTFQQDGGTRMPFKLHEPGPLVH